MKAAGLLGLMTVMLPLLSNAQKVHPQLSDPLVVVQDGKYGYIDHDGGVVIQPQFLWGSAFENGYAAVYVCGRMVSIDVTGKLVTSRTARSEQGLKPKKVDGKFGLVDDSGKLIVPPTFDEVLPFSDGMAAVGIHNKWGFIDATGRLTIPLVYEATYYFREGVATATIGDDDVLIDKNGKVLAKGFNYVVGVTAEQRVPVNKDGKDGYLDLSGALVIPLIYDGVNTFSEGLAPVKKGEKWGYINRDGVTAIPFKFDSAGMFGDGLAPVNLGHDSGFIDVSGKFAFHLAFKYAPGFWDLEGDTDVSRFWTKDGAFGYVNTSGKVIWGPTTGSPDHAPLMGWSEQNKVDSCEGVPDSVRRTVAALPATDN